MTDWTFTIRPDHGKPELLCCTARAATCEQAFQKLKEPKLKARHPVRWLLFEIQHGDSGNTIRFYGQGETPAECFKDGVKECQSIYRPKNDGKDRKPVDCNVTDFEGRQIGGTWKEWEAGVTA